MIALGSNLGDRRGHLEWAAERLAGLLGDFRLSTIHETDPVGVHEPQPPYLNAVAAGLTTLDPVALLDALLALERQRGRSRPAALAPRTLDLDLILYGDRVIETPGLVVPHPRFRERAFVLAPLAEIAPDWVDPVSGETVAALARRLSEGPD